MNETGPRLDLRPDHWAIVRDVLWRHVPDRRVVAFGSRANWTAKEYSDLDLAILGDEPLPPKIASAMAEEFGDSDLPFRVDLVDWTGIDETLRDTIRRDGVTTQVPIRRPAVVDGLRSSLKAFPNSIAASDVDDHATPLGWLFHPSFPAHWRPSRLYSMANWVNGLAFRNIQFSETGRPVIKISEIKWGIGEQTKFTEQMFDESVLVRPGDLLFSWSGQPETSIDAFWWRGPEGWLNQHVFRITPKFEIDASFFFYLLRYLKPNFIGIARNKQTTGLGHVTKRDLKNLEVAYPDLPEQRAIAHILGTLDDKIELNQRTNETLEAIARAIFKDWFVDFGPVRAKIEGRDTGLPQHLAELFPDSLSDSQLGEIPEGWRVKTLGECFNLIMGQSPPGKSYNEQGEGLPFFQGRTDFGFRYPANRKFCTKPTRIAQPGDTLVSVRAPVGDVNVAWQECCIGRGVAALRHKSNSMSFTYYSAREIQNELRKYEHTGTVFGAINRSQFESLNVVDPGAKLVTSFESCVGNLDEKIKSNAENERILIALRDALLPNLVSGKLQLKDPKAFFGKSL